MYTHYTAFNLNRSHTSCPIDGLTDGHEVNWCYSNFYTRATK